MNKENRQTMDYDTSMMELFQHAADITVMGIHVVDLSTMEMYYCNTAGFALIDQDPIPYRGKPCYETFFGLDHPCDNCRIEETKQGEFKHEVYVPQVDKYFLTNTEITTWDGKPVYVEYITDITELKNIQNTQSEMNRQLMGSAREMQRKYELERRRTQEDRKMIAYAAFNLMDGRTIEMERKKPLIPLAHSMEMKEFFEDIHSCVLSEEDGRAFQEMSDRQSLIEKFEQGIEEQRIEYLRVLPTGKVVWVRSIFKLILDMNSQDVLLMYSCYDINMNKSLEIMSSFLANEDYDMLGCVNFHDDSAIMLYGKNSAVSKPGDTMRREESYSEALEWFVNHAVVPEERELYRTDLFVERIKEKLAENPVYEFQAHTIGRHGERLTKKIKYMRYNPKAEISFFTQIDITEMIAEETKKQESLKAALLETKRANQSKSEFFARMSHDMRTPMNGILGLAQLSADESDMEVLKDNMKKIQTSGEYLLGLINDTLDIQRIESGKLELEPRVINVEELKNGVLEMLQPSLDQNKIHFHLIEKNTTLQLYLRIDPVRFKQIFINLISNAIKFTPEGGDVTVVLECMKWDNHISYDRFQVIDTGIGMSEDFIRNKIFQPFSQEYNEMSERYSGSGLGLSIVKSLVELMDGTISVESEPGKGTTFTFELNLEIVDEKFAENLKTKENETIENRKKSLKGIRILMAEDHPLNAEIARKLLEKEGCIITWAKDGRECVEMFEQGDTKMYDMILMDVRMPVMTGLEAAEAIRASEKTDAKTIPIIAMTANAYDEDVKACMEAGMNAHIAKPIDTKVLFETVAGFFEK